VTTQFISFSLSPVGSHRGRCQYELSFVVVLSWDERAVRVRKLNRPSRDAGERRRPGRSIQLEQMVLVVLVLSFAMAMAMLLMLLLMLMLTAGAAAALRNKLESAVVSSRRRRKP